MKAIVYTPAQAAARERASHPEMAISLSARATGDGKRDILEDIHDTDATQHVVGAAGA
jgi:hypothetical protein